jgi:hypothetical protein
MPTADGRTPVVAAAAGRRGVKTRRGCDASLTVDRAAV